MTVNSILTSNLREKAGSNSYNRYEYQVHWIVYHMIDEVKRNRDFIVFCEFHDDMAKVTCPEDPKCMEFFQIKTTEQFNEWNLNRLCKTFNKGKKHSFLGFIFYNFMTFENECNKCHFVSNINMDFEVSSWQSIIKDNKILKVENGSLYNKIKLSIRNEFPDLEKSSFEATFDSFIQGTYLYYGELPLDRYEKIVAGEFFEMLDNANIYTSSSNKLLKDIINEVRKKMKCIVTMPISYTDLKVKKGVSSDVFRTVREQIKDSKREVSKFDEIEDYLIEKNFDKAKVKCILRTLEVHHIKMLDITNINYQDTISIIVEKIDQVLRVNFNKLNETDFIKKKVFEGCSQLTIDKDVVDDVLLEAILYERLLQ